MVFVDSLVTLGCFSKGRSSIPVFLHLCRKMAAICLATGARFYWRYVASEQNVADGPSRGEGLGAALDTMRAHRWRGFPAPLLRFLPKGHQQHDEARASGL